MSDVAKPDAQNAITHRNVDFLMRWHSFIQSPHSIIQPEGLKKKKGQPFNRRSAGGQTGSQTGSHGKPDGKPDGKPREARWEASGPRDFGRTHPPPPFNLHHENPLQLELFGEFSIHKVMTRQTVVVVVLSFSYALQGRI